MTRFWRGAGGANFNMKVGSESGEGMTTHRTEFRGHLN
jgi:hypothetical protein